MDKDHPGSTREGYHWIVRSPMQNQLFFHYQNGSRAQKVVVQLLHSSHKYCLKALSGKQFCIPIISIPVWLAMYLTDDTRLTTTGLKMG